VQPDHIQVYTLGHSNHPIEKFLHLLEEHAITAVADVRSQPFSRRYPHFNKQRLCATLAEHGIAYVFAGAELGARSSDESCYEAGRVQYRRLAATPLFNQGIDRVLAGAKKFRVALMCAEKEPLDCHRTLLVSRALEKRGVAIAHILADGRIEHQPQTMARLINKVGLGGHDLFTDAAALAEEACRLREAKIAYVRDDPALKSRSGRE
jgi:uncharacterized protein (DUF488 family)